jgi:uncharacterized protein
MPHQCIKCDSVYPDGSKHLLKGCPKCKSKFFFFIRKQHLKQAEEKLVQLSDQDREKIEKDVFDIMGLDDDKPVILDFESIRTVAPGKFEIDLQHLFKREPLIYKIEDGKYMIDIPSTFQLRKKK